MQEQKGRLFIQTHNFPDPDAVSSAFGLKNFLEQLGILSQIIYSGVIQRDALIKTIDQLQIPIFHWTHFDMNEKDRIIIVDGCQGNANVEELPGKEIAVIDHHQNTDLNPLPFSDIRPHYGSCSTIIGEYFKEQGLEPSLEVATALEIGISRDTDRFIRNVQKEDIESYSFLYDFADTALLTNILRNNIQLSDLQYFNYLINNLKVYKGLAFVYFPFDCPKNLMGLLGDFIISLQEITFSALLTKTKELINVSFRNEGESLNAATLIKNFTKGMGQGGGHKQMAGGVCLNHYPEDEKEAETFFFNRLLEILPSSLI